MSENQTISFPVYELSKGFRWDMFQIDDYTWVIGIEHCVGRYIPGISSRWYTCVHDDFPQMDTQEKSDLLEAASDAMAERWAKDMLIGRSAINRTRLRIDAMRLRRTKLLTTKTMAWMQPIETASSTAVTDPSEGNDDATAGPNPDEGWDA